MVTLPTSPKGPTVYVVTNTSAADAELQLIEAGIAALGCGPCEIEILPVGPALSESDRSAIHEFLQDTYNAHGAFIFGPDVAFFDETEAVYDVVDEACQVLGEVGLIVRNPGELRAAAPRLLAAVRATNRILPAKTSEVLILGAGPDARALAAALSRGMCGAKPEKITLASTDAAGLTIARNRLTENLPEGRLEIGHVDSASELDRLLALLPPDSAIVRSVNARETDISVTDSAVLFPTGAVIWDFLTPAAQSRFLAAAVPQRKTSTLTLSDGTAYSEESGIVALETMFGDEASDKALIRLREAIQSLSA